MPQTAMQSNPFMLLVDPGRVIAAVEKSERLGRLNRHICRPLDKIPGAAAEGDAEAGPAAGQADAEPATATGGVEV